MCERTAADVHSARLMGTDPAQNRCRESVFF